MKDGWIVPLLAYWYKPESESKAEIEQIIRSGDSNSIYRFQKAVEGGRKSLEEIYFPFEFFQKIALGKWQSQAECKEWIAGWLDFLESALKSAPESRPSPRFGYRDATLSLIKEVAQGKLKPETFVDKYFDEDYADSDQITDAEREFFGLVTEAAQYTTGPTPPTAEETGYGYISDDAFRQIASYWLERMESGAELEEETHQEAAKKLGIR